MPSQTDRGGGGGTLGRWITASLEQRSPASYLTALLLVVGTAATLAAVLVEKQADPNLAALLAGAAVFMVFAIALPYRVRRWLKGLPGLGPDGGWRRYPAATGYSLLLLASAIVPFAAFGVFNAVLAAADTQSCRADIPLIRSDKRWQRRLGWSSWTTGVLVVIVLNVAWVWLALNSDPDVGVGIALAILINASIGLAFALLGLCVAVWIIAADDSLSRQAAAKRLLLVCLLPPVGIQRAKMTDETSPRGRALLTLVMISWVTIYVAVAVIVALSLISRTARWTDWTSVAVRYVICGLALGAVSLIVRRLYVGVSTDLEGGLPAAPARPEYPPSQLTKSELARQRLRAAVVSLALLVGWIVAVSAAGLPWIHAEIGDLSSSLSDTGASQRLIALIFAAIPVTYLSLRTLLPYLPRRATVDGFLPWNVMTAVVMSTLIAAAAFVFSGALLEYQIFRPWLIAIAGFCVGLGAGLSIALAQYFDAAQRRLPVVVCQVAATGFCGLVIYSLIRMAVDEWPQHAALPSGAWLGVAVQGVVGLYLGWTVGGAILVPGFRALVDALSYIKELSWRLVGFVAGYIFIVLMFGGIYFLAYDPGSKSCGESANFTRAPGSDWNMCTLTFKDFAYFSMNTIAPLGYSDVRPRSEPIKALTAAELGMGIAWTVIVFGMLLTWLADRHVRDIVDTHVTAIVDRALERDREWRRRALESSGASAGLQKSRQR